MFETDNNHKFDVKSGLSCPSSSFLYISHIAKKSKFVLVSNMNRMKNKRKLFLRALNTYQLFKNAREYEQDNSQCTCTCGPVRLAYV